MPVVCVRGPSRSGKSSLCERLIAHLETRGIRTGYVKRTHHLLDLPEKASGRIWTAAPTAMLLRTPDRLQLTVEPHGDSVVELLNAIPVEVDVVILETHTAEPYPTILSHQLEPGPGEQVIGRWSLDSLGADAVAAAAAVGAILPADRDLARQLRRASRFHGALPCAGLILGTRLALHGSSLLGIDLLPDRQERLAVVVETQRCAADAIQAVTGCRPGRGTLYVLDYGRLAATFVDTRSGCAVRVAARDDLRARATPEADPDEAPGDAPRRIYLDLADSELFNATGVSNPLNGISCAGCGDEVADGRDLPSRRGRLYQPCALAEREVSARRTV